MFALIMAKHSYNEHFKRGMILMKHKVDKERILSLCEPGNYGIFAPPMKAQVALKELCRYFLGKDRCKYLLGGDKDNYKYLLIEDKDDEYPSTEHCTMKPERINTMIVTEIEQRYRGARIGLFKRKKCDIKHIWKLCGYDYDE